MAIRKIELESKLVDEHVAILVQTFTELGFAPEHIIGFTIFALSGAWQKQFHQPGTSLTKADIHYMSWRIVRELAEKYVHIPPFPALTAFDRLTAEAKIIGDGQELWSAGMQRTGSGILDRSKRPDASEMDKLLAETWWAVRAEFWALRDIPQFYSAAKYALGVLEQRVDQSAIESTLKDSRDLAVYDGTLFMDVDGVVRIGKHQLRDNFSKHNKIPRPRPDRARKASAKKPKVISRPTIDKRDTAAASVEDVAATAELAERFERWVAAQLKTAKPRSAKRAILLYMQQHGRAPQVREFARKRQFAPSVISRALSPLVLALQQHLSRRRPT